MLSRLFVTLSILSLVLSCKEKEQSLPNDLKGLVHTNARQSSRSLTLVPGDTIAIPIDSTTAFVNWVNHFTTTGEDNLLFLYNRNLHRLQLYSLDKKELTNTIQLSHDGPNGIETVSGINFVSEDSIFLALSSAKRRLVLINMTGEVKDQWTITDTLKYTNYLYDLYIYKNFEINYSRKKKTITLSVAPYLPSEDPRCYQYPYILDYDLNSRRVVANYGQFPFEDGKIYLYSELPKHVQVDSFDIVHFSGSHNLYLYDINTKNAIKAINVKSKYLPEALKTIDLDIIINELSEKEKEFYVSEGRYDLLLRDPYRRLYYRFVKHPMEYLRPDGKSKWEPDFIYSILVLDDQFDYITEVTLPPNTYNPTLSFVTRDGLLINMNNVGNNLIDEDHLYFKIFRIHEVK